MAKSRRPRIVPSEEDRACLERIRTNPHSTHKHVRRETIILHLGSGLCSGTIKVVSAEPTGAGVAGASPAGRRLTTTSTANRARALARV